MTPQDCVATRLYLSELPNSRQLERHVDKAVPETEVWVVEIPDHLTQFNGNEFLGDKEDI